MRAAGGLLRAALGIAICLLALGVARAAMAQDSQVTGTDPAPVSSILVVDQDRLFTESAFGKATLERERVATRALEAENSKIEAGLIAEEQDLTTRRATLPAEEFAALASAFDDKVERIRFEQDTKARDLTRAREEDRQAFLRAAGPVLGELMGEKGAVAVLEKSSVILSLTTIDVTDDAIARVDAVLPPDTPPPAEP
jgi:Skp family chaperone for outer membrane proteins